MQRPTNKTGFRAGRDNAAVQENIELLTGQRGNGLDKAVTVRDLTTLGLAEVRRLAQGSQVKLKPVSPSKPQEVIVEQPHAPVSVRATAGFGAILVAWDAPTFQGFAHAEIWRNTIDELSSAALLGTTPATMFTDIVAPGASYYYWVRFIKAKDIAGPYQATDGLLAQTNNDVSKIINEIGEQMVGSTLIKDLNEKGTGAHQQLWSQKAQAGDITAGIGIMADEQGNSQVAIAATQVFVFDPNNQDPGCTLTPMFAIDQENGVVMPKALIESATIQVLESQIIVADKVAANAELTTPVLNSATINGAEINIGVGGSYNNHHFHVNAAGSLFAENATIKGHIEATSGTFHGRLEADTGYFKGDITGASGTFSGTVRADKLVGDVVGSKLVTTTQYLDKNNNTWYTIAQATVRAETFTRYLVCHGCYGTMYGAFKSVSHDPDGYGTGFCDFRILVDGVEVNYSSGRQRAEGGSGRTGQHSHPCGGAAISANAQHTIKLQFRGRASTHNGASGHGSAPSQAVIFSCFKAGGTFY